MKQLSKMVLVFMFIFIQLSGQVYVSSAEKFSERGYLDGTIKTIENKEIISDYDGNLIINYATRIDLPNGLGEDFTITYNSNVEHRIFEKCENRFGYAINAPEWILGYKGFALQTLNFETNFLIKQDDESTIAVGRLEGSEVPMLIPGYHYSNKLDVPTYPNHRDAIRILKSDGSVLSLVNMNIGYPSQDIDIGFYKESGKDSKGFALVSKDSENKRELAYKPGDGLTYLFREKEIDLNFDDINMGDFRIPKVFYLISIYGPNCDTTPNSEREYIMMEYEKMEVGLSNSHQEGRELFKGITSHRTALDNINFDYEIDMVYSFLGSYDGSYSTLTGLDILNKSGQNLSLTISQAGDINGDLVRNTRDHVNLRRKCRVTEIKDDLQRTDKIYYQNKTNAERHYFGQISGSSGYFHFYNQSYLISEIEYHYGSKSKFTYYDKVFKPPLQVTALNLSAAHQANQQNFIEAFRDCYTNYMISNKTIYSNDDELLKVREDNYDYWVTQTTPAIVYNQPNVEGIFTKISTQGYVDGIVPEEVEECLNITRIKEFKKFKTDEFVYTLMDRSSVIKLMSESLKELTSSTKKIKTTTDYYEGSLVQSGDWTSWFMNGSFEIESILEEYTPSSGPTISKTINYPQNSYLYNTIFFKNLSGTVVDQIDILQESIEEDPLTLKTYTKYLNFLSGDLNASSDPKTTSILGSSIPTVDQFIKCGYTTTNKWFYKINNLERKIDYSGLNYTTGIKRTSNKIEYFESGADIGKVKKSIDNYDMGRENYVEYEYNTTVDDKLGLVSNIDYDGRIEQIMTYPSSPVFSKYKTGVVTLFDKSVTTNTFYHVGLQLKPFQTTLLYNNGNSSIDYYNSFDTKGNLNFEIDHNGLYSMFEYDGCSRLIASSFPGSFTSATTSSKSLSISYLDDINNEISQTFTTNTKTDPSDIENINYKNTYNSLLQKIAYEVESQKDSTFYNFMGLVSRKNLFKFFNQYYSYNFLHNLISTTLGQVDDPSEVTTYNWSSGTISNGALTKDYFQYQTITDENLKTKTSYYDKVGNLIAEQLGSNTPTIFNFDDLYRLISVTSPGGKVTSYYYDDHNNISQKVSPDAGVEKFKYDKYSNLRFALHDNSVSPKIDFNTYDDFNRMVNNGYIIASDEQLDWVVLDPDEDYDHNINYPGEGVTIYSFENPASDSADWLTINQYDDFTSTSIGFSGVSYPNYTLTNLKGRLSATAFRSKLGQTWNYKLYSYDHLGRINCLWIKFRTEDWKTIEYTYDHAGKMLTISFGTWNTSTNTVDYDFFYWYEYDNKGRLDKVYTNEVDDYVNAIKEIEYIYSRRDIILQVNFPSVGETGHIEQINYYHNMYTDRLEEITSSYSNSVASGERFYQSLGYYDNGNIESMLLENNGQSTWADMNFSYTYDNRNWLTDVSHLDGNYDEHFEYDADGNFTIKNNNLRTSTYVYYGGTNKIATYLKTENQNIIESNYSYDYRGNVTSDDLRGTSSFVYDNRNLPLSLVKGGQTYYYDYDDTGNRIYKNVLGEEEYYLRDHTGRELAVYDLNTGKLKFANIFGHGIIGRVELFK